MRREKQPQMNTDKHRWKTLGRCWTALSRLTSHLLPLFFFFSLTPHLWADVPNGGFEQITASQIPVNWSPLPDSTRVMVEHERAHSGKISVLMLGGPRGEPHRTDERSRRYSAGSRLCLNRMGACRQRKGLLHASDGCQKIRLQWAKAEQQQK